MKGINRRLGRGNLWIYEEVRVLKKKRGKKMGKWEVWSMEDGLGVRG